MDLLTVSRGVPYAVPVETSMPKMIPTFRGLKLTSSAERPIYLIAILLAILHAAMALTAVNTKSPTFDEPQHLTAGYSYFVTNDFRLDPESGNLPAVWAALPLLFDNLKFIPTNDRGWQRGEEGRTAHQFLYEAGNDPDQMLRQARVMMSIFGAALCLLIYYIARQLFGMIGGLIAEIIVAFDPNFLAHSPLVTSDVPAAFFFTASVWTCWRLFQKITPASLLLAALSVSGLFLTKFSALLVLPVLGAMGTLQIFSGNEITLQFARFRIALTEKWKKALAVAGASFVLCGILFIAIWASYSFRYTAWTDNRASHEGTAWHWNYLLEDHGLFETSVSFARTHHLLPEAYLYGFAYVHKHEIDRPAFLDNQWSVVGFRSFFPKAFLYKTPLPFLLLLALAIYAGITNRHAWKIESIFNPLCGFAVLYGAFAITAQLNIGHRHLLPIYPVLFVSCGVVTYLLHRNWRLISGGIIGILLCWEIAESLAIQPDYLAYFNQLAGGPGRGYKHLVDSSLDWGQDLPALKSWIDNQKPMIDQKAIYLGYFGTADPRSYEIDARLLASDKQFSRTSSSELTGGIYFVSATTLQSVYALEIGPWCKAYEQRYQTMLRQIQRSQTTGEPTTNVVQITNATQLDAVNAVPEFERLRFARLCAYLRHQSPIAQIGYSIFVFNLSDDEVRAALFGPPAEVNPEISVIGY